VAGARVHALGVMAAAGTVLVIGGWVMAIALAVGVNFNLLLCRTLSKN